MFLLELGQSIPKKIAKRLKNTILGIFLAKPGQDKPRKRNFFFFFHSDPFLPNPGQSIPKKIKKTSFWLYFQSYQVRTGRERGKKKNHSDPFLPKSGQSIPKKKTKKLKNIIRALFLYKPCWDRLRNRRKKKFVPICSYLTRARAFPKKQQ